MDYSQELETAKELAKKAGQKIMEIYNSGKYEVCFKDQDNYCSPLTRADTLSNQIIVNGLRSQFPQYGLITEEEKNDFSNNKKAICWIIDPLDGTKEFINRNGEFTVNIALVRKGEPVLGVIYLPVTKELFYAVLGQGTYWEKNGERRRLLVSDVKDLSKMTLVKSRSHASTDLVKLASSFGEVIVSGSSIKGCLIARQKADVYFRLGSVYEWDICAMHVILSEAGGTITNLEGQPLNYIQKNNLFSGFIASNNRNHQKLIDLFKEKISQEINIEK